MRAGIKRIGEVSYDELDSETKDDVVHSIMAITDEEDVRIGLENGPSVLPLVAVDPTLIYSHRQGFSEDIAEDYANFWRRGAAFPPVVIDSSRVPPLIEGRHRIAAAVKAGIRKIVAIDLAGVHVKKTPDGFETYGFRR
jgi:hypothetical protein